MALASRTLANIGSSVGLPQSEVSVQRSACSFRHLNAARQHSTDAGFTSGTWCICPTQHGASAVVVQAPCQAWQSCCLTQLPSTFTVRAKGAKAHSSQASLLLMQVSRYQDAAALLEDTAALAQLHYDRGRGHFADFGNHTEALQLGYSLIRAPSGQPVGREVKRVPTTPGHPPQPQMVPHYG